MIVINDTDFLKDPLCRVTMVPRVTLNVLLTLGPNEDKQLVSDVSETTLNSLGVARLAGDADLQLLHSVKAILARH